MPSPVDLAIKTDVPLLLFPVRLETRFRGTELLIRIYPDDVQIDSFERRLTDAEIQWGKHFWEQTRVAGDDQNKQLNAWAQLAYVFGPRRAAWIAKKTDPTGPEPTRADPTTPHTPCTTLLPNHWIASGTAFYDENGQPGSLNFSVQGREVKYAEGSDCIYVLPRLDQPGNGQALQDDPHAGWLVEFEKAEAIGMGIRVSNLPNVNLRIDQLLVYGIKASLDPTQGKDRLEGLLEAHHYTQGLAFVSQGTPTNNTINASSGYNSGESETVDSFEIERQQTALTDPDPDSQPNYAVMAKALGIDPDILVNMRDAITEEQRAAQEMNKVLWQATWGDFLEKMLELANSHRTGIDAMKQHFVEYVRARGPLPSLRIGQQPYGVLPVLPLGDSGGDSVQQGLRALREIWLEAMEQKDERGDDLVPRLTKSTSLDDRTLTLLRILAMAPTGLSYVGRPCTRIVPLSAPVSPEGLAKTGQTPLPDLLKKALDALLGPNTMTPHQRTIFASHSNLLTVKAPGAQENDAQVSNAAWLFNLLRDKSQDATFLATLPPKDQARLLSETLDLCSHRLDAWITSSATKRLKQLREKHPTGIAIGGYGWVEDLKQDTENRASDGFIHAPSLAHATTAAVLRSGYQSRRTSQTATDCNALAVNLSSDRVRLALHLIDGVRGGQSLSTLLGYRFERDLHEHGHDHCIPAFRKIAPGSADLVSPDEPIETTKAKLAHVVLDGLKLLAIYKEQQTNSSIKTISLDLLDTCQIELQHLLDAVDAVADIAVAESVHHVVQGNHVRAGATLEAIARGEAPPPELDFIRTPRTGLNHTHRIGLLIGAPTAVPHAGVPPRAQAEPSLNGWAAQLLGPHVDEAACTVHYTDATGTNTLRISIKDLGLAPLDLVYLLDSDIGGQQSEIERRVLYHVLKDRPSITTISLDFKTTPGNVPPGLLEILEVARTIRRLITDARPIESHDLDLPENVSGHASILIDPLLLERVSTVRLAFTKATEALRGLIPAKPDNLIATSNLVQEAMKNLAAYGVMGAIPIIPLAPNDSPDRALKNLYAQALSVLEEAEARLKRAQALPTPLRNNSEAIAVAHEMFGKEFCVLPAFKPSNDQVLQQTFKRSTELQGGNPFESLTWFQRIARVREGAARLDATMLYAEALNGPLLSFQVGQLPYFEGDRWVALVEKPTSVEPDDNLLQRNRLSLAFLTPETIAFSKPMVGLLIDEWVETVPNKQEVTGLTFHYDSPQSRAPQALLLAMAPEGVEIWDAKTLECTLQETLALAKLRAVDLTALRTIGQYLPAMYFEHDPGTGQSPFA